MLSLCCHANSGLLGAATGMNTFPVNSEMVQHHCARTHARARAQARTQRAYVIVELILMQQPGATGLR